MDIFKNNLTFAVVGEQGSWRTDLTARYCQFWSSALAGENFSELVRIFPSIDSALSACTTDYLIVQTAGNIIFKEQFMSAVSAIMSNNLDLVVGLLKVEKDYVTLDPSCFLVNIPLWRAASSPKYHSAVREGPILKIMDCADRTRPLQIRTDYSDRVFVNNEAAAAGAELIIRQLEIYSKVTALSQFAQPQDFFFLDQSTPYSEIHNETIFERHYLEPARRQVRIAGDPDCAAPQGTQAQVLVTPAHGLRPRDLAKRFGVKRLIIYDPNPLALDFQRKIFSVDAPYLYSEIIDEFLLDPRAPQLRGELGELADLAVSPTRDLEVTFVQADAFSFEIEDIVSEIDDQISVIFDFSDLFVDPHSFYRRPLYQVQGLFAQVYSMIKSRRGPSRVIGLAPGFLNLDQVDINTSSRQFDPEVLAQYEAAVDAATSETVLEPPPPLPDMFFKPHTLPAEQELRSNYKNL